MEKKWKKNGKIGEKIGKKLEKNGKKLENNGKQLENNGKKMIKNGGEKIAPPLLEPRIIHSRFQKQFLSPPLRPSSSPPAPWGRKRILPPNVQKWRVSPFALLPHSPPPPSGSNEPRSQQPGATPYVKQSVHYGKNLRGS